jgi:superfamily II DNA or RNA helicase
MTSEETPSLLIPFGPSESLQLHQLRLLEWHATTGQKRRMTGEPAESEVVEPVPDRWELTHGIQPYEWQTECIARWFAGGRRGTVKVVTGAGKTLLAMAIAEQLQNHQTPDLCVAIVVPTIVLMHQWYDALLEHGNLPASAIGRLGGGYQQDFEQGRRVLIAVLASAHKGLPRIVKHSDAGGRLLLIADECHRAGATEMSQVFKTSRAYSLGLSATPERDEDADTGYDESPLGQEIGPIIYEYNLAHALRDGLVPKFTINHYGLPMAPDERSRYDALSRSISDAMSTLKNHRDSRASDGDFFSWARNVASRNKGQIGAVAIRFIGDTTKRKELLYRLKSRHRAVSRLIAGEFRLNPGARVILFHESIDQVMDLYVQLQQEGFKVIAEHSELPGSIREAGLDLFRKGTAQIIVSARSLIEGFNVPAVDVGIIVASSGSVRQRIQSLGRVLRRHRGPSGEEKTSCIHVLYAANSVEEYIYGKVDWDATTGVDRNQYFLWNLESEPQEQDGPPQTPLPTDQKIDPGQLVRGCEYPGQYEGIEFSFDSQGNITNAEGEYASDTAQLTEVILQVKKVAGRFRVTPNRRYVLVRVPEGDEWTTRYVTRLAEPLEFRKTEIAVEISGDDWRKWAEQAKPGAPYPFGNLKVSLDNLRFKRKQGGVISRRIRGGEAYARNEDRATEREKGADARRAIDALNHLLQRGRNVSKILVNEAGHVLFREGGKEFFVCALEKGLEFPEDLSISEKRG